jgi:hypothetical protein
MAIIRLEGLCKLKYAVTSGIERAAFRNVAYSLTQLSCRVSPGPFRIPIQMMERNSAFFAGAGSTLEAPAVHFGLLDMA